MPLSRHARGQIYAVMKESETGSGRWRANSRQGDHTVKAPQTTTRQSAQTGFRDKPLAQFVWYLRRSVFWFWSCETCDLAGPLIAETALI